MAPIISPFVFLDDNDVVGDRITMTQVPPAQQVPMAPIIPPFVSLDDNDVVGNGISEANSLCRTALDRVC